MICAGRWHGLFCISTTNVSPSGPCNREDGGTWLKSGMPFNTKDAFAHIGLISETPMASAIFSSSSADMTDN